MTVTRSLLALTTAALVLIPGLAIPADPVEDVRAFQYFFHKRFPDVPFDDFANGVYALPMATEERSKFEQSMRVTPFDMDLQKGKQFWEQHNLGSCFKNNGRNIAQHYPYWDERTQMVRTVELDINECLQRMGKPPIEDLQKEAMAQVAAYMKSLSRGQRVRIDVSTAGARDAYDEGRRFYWAKRGQLNLSCADCHVVNAGKRYGGQVLSAGLGHIVGYPAYRLKWGGLGTLHWRYATCSVEVGAAPFKAQSRQYRHLEFYETIMQHGLPLAAPSLRP